MIDNQPQSNDDVKEKKPREAPLMPFMWKKGQSGNPAGRPKGKTMKEYARELLEFQTEEERQEFLHGLPKEVIWKMAEGNPDNKTDLTTKGDKIVATDELVNLAKQLNEITRSNSRAGIASNGTDTEPMGTEVQD